MPPNNGTKQPTSSRKRVYLPERSYRQSVIMLVTGDILCFLIFTIIGGASHNEVTGLANVPHLVLISLPFIAGWFLTAPFLGMFRRELLGAPRAMAYRTALAWIPAWVIAMILRGVFFDHAIPAPAFMLIAFFFNLAILEIWRWPFALNNLARKRGS
jgi:Protein of unknown function (DUF3054)